MTRAVGDASRIRGCLRGAMHVCKTADEPSDPRAFYLNMRDDLDTTKVQRNGGDGGDANETRWQSERQNERMRHVVAILSSPRVPSLQRISWFCFVYLSAPLSGSIMRMIFLSHPVDSYFSTKFTVNIYLSNVSGSCHW